MTAHIVPTRVYYRIFGLLLLFTYVTTQIAFIDLGRLNTIAALTIAVVKATLVVLFFMHIKYSKQLTRVALAGGLFWLALLLSMTMGDYLTRSWRA